MPRIILVGVLRWLKSEGLMNDEEFVKEMENYSDLFIDEVARVGRRSTFPDPDSINIGLSVLCVRLTVTARFGTTGDDFVTEDVHAVLFKTTIDQGNVDNKEIKLRGIMCMEG
jgi:hypothetical protein